MNADQVTLTCMWVIGGAVFLGILFRGNRRFVFGFLIVQAIVWIPVMLHTFFGLVSYPVREFPRANDFILIDHYLIYPLVGAYLTHLEKGVGKTVQFIAVPLLLGMGTGLLEHYTNLIRFHDFAWYGVWIELTIVFWLADWLTARFFAHPKRFAPERRMTS